MYIFPEDLRKAYESIPIPIVIDQLIDGKVVPLLVSDGFCALVGMDRETAVTWFTDGQFERLHPDDVGNVLQVSDAFARRQSGYDVIFRSRHPDGYHTIHAVGSWMTMQDRTELAMIAYMDVTESGREIQALLEQYDLFRQDHFYTDPVTGLPNTNYLPRFADERAHTLRVAGKTPALLYFDVNSMQSYNIQYGVAAGDDLLRLISMILTDVFPDSLIARGVEDHMIVITGCEDESLLAKKVLLVNSRIRREASGNTTGIHAGICIYSEDTTSAEALDHARNALKLAETDMNKCYRFHSFEADELYWNQRYIVENFDQALEKGWFKVYYQGIERLSTGKGTAFEALARWVDPVRGIIPPNDFIPTLGKYHLLYKLDLYIFEQVCRELRLRQEAGLPLVPVSVNFARQDFDHADIANELNALTDCYAIDQLGLGKDSFAIEITEHDMATATGRFYDQLRRIRKSGFRLWLDDFGSGYSSLNVFSRFEIDLIKFDMDLLRHLDAHNGANREIIKAMIGVADHLGIHTLAEGIETEAQKQFLTEVGCELGQGYAIHKPEPLDAILYRLKCGQRIRVHESPEERKAQAESWLQDRSAHVFPQI